MALQRVDRLKEPPVVGCYYMVPCIIYFGWGRTDEWPVMGVRHTDVEHLSFPYLHYHLDIRFLTARQVKYLEQSTLRRLEYEAAVRPLNSIEGSGSPSRCPFYKRLRCRTADHDYPTKEARASPQFRDLWTTFDGKQCKRGKHGWICPHKQFPLGSIAPIDGVITCPLHGLRIDAKTGVCLGATK